MADDQIDFQRVHDWLVAHGLKPGTIHNYLTEMKVFARWFESTRGRRLTRRDLTQGTLEQYEGHLTHSRGRSPRIANRLTGPRALLRWCRSNGEIDRDPLRETGFPGLEAFIQWLRRRGLAESSLADYRKGLRSFARWHTRRTGEPLTPSAATSENFEAFWADHLARGWLNRRQYRLRCLRAVQAFARWGAEMRGATAEASPPHPLPQHEEAFALWLRGKGKSEHTLVRYLQEIRAFAKWFEDTYGEPFKPEGIDAETIGRYREHLAALYAPRSARPRLNGVRAYAHWAVESGLLAENPLDSSGAPGPKEAEVAELDAFEAWLLAGGLSQSSLFPIRSRLVAFARWHRESKGETITPADATPENFRQFWEDASRRGSSPRTRSGYKSALRRYARWGVETGRLDRNPFESRSEEFDAFAEWLRGSGKSEGAVKRYLNGMRAFSRWFAGQTQKVVRPENIEPEDLEVFARDQLESGLSSRKAQERLLALRTFMAWGGREVESPPPVLQLSNEVRSQLENLVERSFHSSETCRARALLDLADGATVKRTAKRAGVSRQAVYNWLRRLAEAFPKDVTLQLKSGAGS